MGFCKTVALHKSAALVFFPGDEVMLQGLSGFLFIIDMPELLTKIIHHSFLCSFKHMK